MRRAQTVSGYLSCPRFATWRIESFGYGEKAPRESNETADGRQLGRRVEISIKA